MMTKTCRTNLMRRVIWTLFKLFIPFLNAISIILRTHLKWFLSSIFSSQIEDDEMSIFSMTQRKLGLESKNFQANFWISQKKNRENVAVKQNESEIERTWSAWYTYCSLIYLSFNLLRTMISREKMFLSKFSFDWCFVLTQIPRQTQFSISLS